MTTYQLCKVLHLVALTLWLGHMFFWSLVVGPVTKRHESAAAGERLRQRSLRAGGLGWPALAVLAMTGSVMAWQRGLVEQARSGELLAEPGGVVLALKLVLVLCMVAYQAFVGHRRAPRLIYLNMLVALLIVGLSVLLIRDPALVVPS